MQPRHWSGPKPTSGPKPEKRLEHLVMFSIGTQFPGENFVWKFHASEFDPPGIPDIIGSIQGRFVGLELKMEGNYFSEFQKTKMLLISQSGGIACGVIQMKDESVWLLTNDVVQSFTLRDRTRWLPLAPLEWIDAHGGRHPVLNLAALKVLL